MRPFEPRLLRELPAARGPVAALGAVGVAQGALAIGQAFAVSAVVVAIAHSSGLGAALAWLVGILAVRALLTALGEVVASWAGTAVSTALRRRVLASWLGRRADDRPDAARAQTMATQGASAVEPYVARYLPTLVQAAVLPALAVITMAFVDWPSALICVLTLPLLPLFAALIGMATRDASDSRWAAMTVLAGHFLDTVRGLPALVAYGRAERQAGQLREVSQRHRAATVATLRIAFLSSAALELLATISVALVAVSVGIRLTWGSIDLLHGMIAIMLAPEAYWPIRRVGQEFHNAADGAQALDELLDETGPESSAIPGMPRLDAVDYRYPGATTDVVHGRSLQVGPGLTVITGPSGSGKTTTLELLAGLRAPTAGATTGTAHLVTQRPFLPAGTLGDALALGTRATPEQARTALTRVGLDLPLDLPLGDDGFGLSAGQRARVAVARALLADAPVVALDEPTAHLDPASAGRVHEVLRSLADERPVVVVTHRPELVALADEHVEVTR